MTPSDNKTNPASERAPRAFPVSGVIYTADASGALCGASGKIDDPGMTLRDYFAAKALQGLLANPQLQPAMLKASLAAQCYDIADNLMGVRKAT